MAALLSLVNVFQRSAKNAAHWCLDSAASTSPTASHALSISLGAAPAPPPCTLNSLSCAVRARDSSLPVEIGTRYTSLVLRGTELSLAPFAAP